MKDSTERTIGLRGATGIGVGAIVGGGILVLGGVAFQSTGPSAVLAFLFNGIIAILTALSCAQMAAAFPESGGTYVFAKKVLSVRAAFGAGWILWFAYIVAAALYAMGFAAYALASIAEGLSLSADHWLRGPDATLLSSIVASVAYALMLARKASGGGQIETIGKMILFAILIVAGLIAIVGTPVAQWRPNLSPFFHGGSLGLFQAMGYTFIALQGFDLIAAVGGEVKEPRRVIPRAMLYSLAIALAVYLPLLFVVSTVGVPDGTTLAELSRRHPDTFMAEAARQFMGDVGYWMVMLAAVLSTLSALQANLLAASRVAERMAIDQMLPSVIAQRHPTRNTPVMAVYASTLTLVAILVMVTDLAAAGAASSLIFLLSFALAHATSYLARKRGHGAGGKFEHPIFAWVPLIGGVACAGMAVFQSVAEPGAGVIVGVWLGLGGILYFSLFSTRAETADAATEARSPELLQVRGRSPLVLVPVANPQRASALVSLATAIAPKGIGRVVLMSVMRKPDEVKKDAPPQQLVDVSDAVTRALHTSLLAGHQPQALISIADSAFTEIEQSVHTYQPRSVVLGFSGNPGGPEGAALEGLIDKIDAGVAVLRAPIGWHPEVAKTVLVPVGGRGRHHEMRARILGSLWRAAGTQVRYLKIVSPNATDDQIKSEEYALRRLGRSETPDPSECIVVRSDDVTKTIVEHANEADLVLLGIQSIGGQRRFGKLTLAIAQQSDVPLVMVAGEHETWHPQAVFDGIRKGVAVIRG